MEKMKNKDNDWKLSDFLTNDDFLNERVAEILVNRYETNGGQLNFSNEKELLAFVVTELTRMAVFQSDVLNQDSRRITEIGLSGFNPFISHIGQKLANRIQKCRAVLVNIFVPGCKLEEETTTTTTTTTTTRTTISPVTPPPALRNMIKRFSLSNSIDLFQYFYINLID